MEESQTPCALAGGATLGGGLAQDKLMKDKKKAKNLRKTHKQPVSSAGHRLGQLIGDWWEEYLALPLLNEVAGSLELYLDCRFNSRTCRGEKIDWPDEDGNNVDYDFVLELDGTSEKRGIPVAFLETFWRRGARHSKDKARDDSGKLSPMRNTYPTARFLGILALGDFTAPAKQYVTNRDIKLLCIPKEKAISAFRAHNLTIDYPDKLPESDKLRLVEDFQSLFTDQTKKSVADKLRELVGLASFRAYQNDFSAVLSALPQEIKIVRSQHGYPVVFASIREAAEFLNAPTFRDEIDVTTYRYSVQYSDGTEFERELSSVEDIRVLNEQLGGLADHMERLAREAPVRLA